LAETIGINTPNPHDITPAEAEEIAEAIRGLDPKYDAKVSVTERTDYGITWFEVLRIALAGGAFVGRKAAEEVAKKIMDIVIAWARERFKRKRPVVRPRPVYVAIYGPDGVLKSVTIKNATDEPEDRTEEDQQRARNLSGKVPKETDMPTIKQTLDESGCNHNLNGPTRRDDKV